MVWFSNLCSYVLTVIDDPIENTYTYFNTSRWFISFDLGAEGITGKSVHLMPSISTCKFTTHSLDNGTLVALNKLNNH